MTTFLPPQNVVDKMDALISVDKIVVHHGSAGTENWTLEQLLQCHTVGRKEEGKTPFVWIGYHFVIKPTGEVVQCRPDNKAGAHCPGRNFNSLSICFLGDYRVQEPTPDAWRAFTSLVGILLSRYSLQRADIETHGAASGNRTECPGEALSRAIDRFKNETVSSDPQTPSLADFSTRQIVDELSKRIT